MSYYKKLTGERVYLSPLSGSDEEARKLTEWFSDPRVSETMGMSAAVLTASDQRAWIGQAGGAGGFADEFGVTAGEKYFAIVLTETDELLGYCELRGITLSHRTATLGIMVGTARGRGYGTDALALLLRYGFCDLGLHSINLTVFDGNSAALRMYEKAGFRHGGKQRESAFVGGRFIDRHYMDILSHEYFENVFPPRRL